MAISKEEGPSREGGPSRPSTSNRNIKRTRRRRRKSALPPCTCTGYGTCVGCKIIEARREKARLLKERKGGPRD